MKGKLKTQKAKYCLCQDVALLQLIQHCSVFAKRLEKNKVDEENKDRETDQNWSSGADERECLQSRDRQDS